MWLDVGFNLAKKYKHLHRRGGGLCLHSRPFIIYWKVNSLHSLRQINEQPVNLNFIQTFIAKEDLYGGEQPGRSIHFDEARSGSGSEMLMS